MRIAAAHGLTKLIDNVRRRRLIRITHAEIDNVLTTRACSLLQLANDVENIRGQPLNPLKVCIQNRSRLSGLTQSKPRTAAKSAAGR